MKIISKKINAEIDELSYLNICREVYLNLQVKTNPLKETFRIFLIKIKFT